MNQFTERYKTLSNPDLLKIIVSPGDYQPLAVEAAKAELTNRGLNEDDLAEANAENEALDQEKYLKYEKKKTFENKIKDAGNSLLDNIHPIQQAPPSVNKIINILSILFAIMSLIDFFKVFGLLKFILTYKAATWHLANSLYIFYLALQSIAAFLFWKRKKSGWILLCLYCSFLAIADFVVFFMILWRRWSAHGAGGFSPMPPVSTIWNLFFFGACLWLIFKNSIREVYNIDKQTMFLTTVIGVLAAVSVIIVEMGI